MSASLSIRAAKASDLTALLGLYSELNPADPPLDPVVAEERMAAILSQPGMRIFISFSGEAAAATVSLIVVPNLSRNGASYALIENVVTSAGHRKQGHGARLIAHAIAAAWDAGCYKVMLLTGSDEPATHLFYTSCGFRQDKTGYQVRRPAALQL